MLVDFFFFLLAYLNGLDARMMKLLFFPTRKSFGFDLLSLSVFLVLFALFLCVFV